MTGVLLFDWTEGGHHSVYLRRAVEALRDSCRVVVAAPERERVQMDALGAEFISLGDARPADDPDGDARKRSKGLAETELSLFSTAIRRSRVDRAIHLYADPVLRHLVRRPRFDVPVDILMFFPTWHYPSTFGDQLSKGERARALFREGLVRRWRTRRDAGTTYTLDEVCTRRWAAQRGRPVAWLPEPPVAAPDEATARAGCVVYGALSRHKGLPLVAAALEAAGQGLQVTIAGTVAPDLGDSIDDLLLRMRSGGAQVDLRARRHSEAEGLELLGSASCAVLAYPRHIGMSRVLVEAASVGTPVVTNNFGLLGYLVRQHHLGDVVACDDPLQLAGSLRAFSDPTRAEIHSAALRNFSARYSEASFRRALMPGRMGSVNT